jgi:hypothetical protein
LHYEFPSDGFLNSETAVVTDPAKSSIKLNINNTAVPSTADREATHYIEWESASDINTFDYLLSLFNAFSSVLLSLVPHVRLS